MAEFTEPSKYCQFNADSKLARQAKRLARKTSRDTISEVYRFMSTRFYYDYDKAKRLAGTGGYVPDPEDTYTSRKGVCFDIASLMCAMLRSLGIPAKLVIGYRDGKLHAWVSAHDGKTWVRCDPTCSQRGATYERLEEK